ncbi:MAG TPA: YihY/virulence factor BrkB family protein [Thermoleophilaceae bacterium]|jgi:membrane protein|nr:YihY/virulence factor BrkB family protein [Thermoleophilaceae bacterium]
MARRNNPNGNGDAPETPTDVQGRGWGSVLKRTVKEFREDNLTDWAAALTYYGVLALFPALIALVSIVGLLGQSTINGLKSNIQSIPAAGQAKQIVLNAITEISSHKSAAGIALIVGLALALWSASGYVGAFMRASNAIYETPEGRPFYRLRPLQMLVTLFMLVLIALCAAAIVVTGPVTQKVGQAVGLGGTAQTVFDVVKWPIILVVISFIFSLLYYASPNVKHPGFKWITPGGVLAVIIWIVASAAFALYVKFFPNNKTYGSFGGVIVFLMWLWISNIAVLLGQEMNAELERQRELAAGLPAERELQLPPRAVPKEG